MTHEAPTRVEDGIAFLAIQGKRDLNLLGMEVFHSLDASLEQLRKDDLVRAVVLHGQGERAFSAGVDVNEMKDLTPPEAEEFIRSLHQVLRKILTLPQPVVAAINGPCLGGALEMALACDIRIAAEDAMFGLPEVRVGVPSVIEASLLPRTVGLGRARRLALTGETVPAQEALGMGLVDRVVPKDGLKRAALDTAQGFLAMSPYVLSVQKDVVASWLEMGEEEAAEYSMKAFALCFATGHPHEAMTAFLEKREPRFTDK